MTRLIIAIVLCIGIWHRPAVAQDHSVPSIPDDWLLDDDQLLAAIAPDIPELRDVYEARDDGRTLEALEMLAQYFKNRSADRYYFDWRRFRERFDEYQVAYPDRRRAHFEIAALHMSAYAPETSWELPFKNLRGQDVTAYQLRHLARQQKASDMALVYYYSGEDSTYLRYFVRQVADLNRAFKQGRYDDEGNGVYERFRAGKRVHNWLFCHHAYLATDQYQWQDQVLLIKTFLHHGAQLARRTEHFHYGNHHTKGLVALFQIGTIFREFVGADAWIRQALDGLDEHMQREVNTDGFQFERTVHYHKGDIDNYFRVLQLADLNSIPVSDLFRERLRQMFKALVHIAQPNRRAPVLQDDTDRPYAENNRLDDVMTIGALLYDEPMFKYFTDGIIPSEVYWLFRTSQFERLATYQPMVPSVGSVALEETGYFVMRNGWSVGSEHMVISAGFSEKKPDHQQGEMLSLTAFANGHEILPNYQVNYNIPDYEYWKNSWVKSVALVDSVLLGRDWQGNRGGSGFGKWKTLPRPSVDTWISRPWFDYFNASHDGYEAMDVGYRREVLFLKEGFWIVRDHFESQAPHDYQQVWQGHFSRRAGLDVVRSSFDDGSGVDIAQLGMPANRLDYAGRDGKQRAVFTFSSDSSMSLTTLIYPFESYHDAIEPDADGAVAAAGTWRFGSRGSTAAPGVQTDALVFMASDSSDVILDATHIRLGDREIRLSERSSLIVERGSSEWVVTQLSRPTKLSVVGGSVIRSDGISASSMETQTGDVVRVEWTSSGSGSPN